MILRELGENLIKASSGKEALEHLLKNEIAVVLMDVCMPELDGFELASMIREHPRFQKIAMIFISAIHLAEIDHLRGYEMGAVDYVPVPVVPEVLRAKVRVFTDLYRKNRQLERLNAELERRVAERTAELEASTSRLLESEQRRSFALAAGNMGSWDWDLTAGKIVWDEGQHAIYGVVPGEFIVTPEHFKVLIVPEDWERLQVGMQSLLERGEAHQAEFRVRRPNGEVRWCESTAAATPRRRGQGRPHQRRHDGHHGAQEGRGAAGAAGARGRPSRQERDGDRAVDRPPHQGGQQGGLRFDHRGPHQGAVARACAAVQLALAGRRSRKARQRGACAVPLDPCGPHRHLRARRSCSSRPRRRRSRSRCTSLPPMRRNTARCRRRRASSWCAGTLEADALVIQWHETAGPETHKPSATGFGTKIITGSIERQLGGKTDFEWAPTGLRCTLTVPRGERLDAAAPAASEVRAANPPVRPVAARRVMIVEDEALVALVLADHLTEFGLSVVGPCANVAEATAAVEANDLDAAILDVNLGKELVYPVAELLCEARHPVRVRHRLRAGEHRQPVCPCGRAGETGGAGLPEEHFRHRAGEHSGAAGGAERVSRR